jgi:DnaJ-class molecular chaperone
MTVLRMVKCPTCIGMGYCDEADLCPSCEGTGEVPNNEVIIDEPCQPLVRLTS